MKHGLSNFSAETQGGRTTQGQKKGENYITEILKILNIEIFKNIDKKAKGKNMNYFLKEEEKNDLCANKDKIYMTPDFIIKNPNNSFLDSSKFKWIFLESKYKQINGSDWEKLESNFGYHEYFYNNLLNCNSKTIVILSGFWKKLQKPYPVFVNYFKEKYGENTLFDFGLSIDEILRFANFLGVDINAQQHEQIEELWEKHKLG